MSKVVTEYRVVWMTESGREEFITRDSDYQPLGLQQAIAFANGRKRHAAEFKDIDPRVEARQITVSDWNQV